MKGAIYVDHEKSDMNTTDGYDLGTFNFLQVGWWILHIVAIAGIFYLGAYYAGKFM